jgi:hypothetical protein
MAQIKNVFLIATTNQDVARFIENRCQTLSNINNVYLIASDQSIDEFKKSLEPVGNGVCLFEISAFEYSGDYHQVASWIEPLLILKVIQARSESAKGSAAAQLDPYATRRLDQE